MPRCAVLDDVLTAGSWSADITLLAGDAATSSSSSTDVDGFLVGGTASSAITAAVFYNNTLTLQSTSCPGNTLKDHTYRVVKGM